MSNSFQTKASLLVDGQSYTFFRLPSLAKQGFDLARLPLSIKILLENVLRHENGATVTRAHIEQVASWQPGGSVRGEFPFSPSRVLLQDYTGVPALVDLATLRDAVKERGGDPNRINPLIPVELVIDHSVQVDAFGTKEAFAENQAFEYARNAERYRFLRWGQQAFRNFTLIPPQTGIVHQVNLEHLARVVFVSEEKDRGAPWIYPDTLVGTDSHTTMINGLGVLGWGVGGIEAEAAMLGIPFSMLLPEVVGVELTGALPEGATATDLVLTLTQKLRAYGVVGMFVEFFGEGLAHLPVADRATLANMAPEYGATCGFFPIDEQTLRYLRLTGRSESTLHLVERYAKEQGLFRSTEAVAEYSHVLRLDLGAVEPCLAGPSRPQDRVFLRDVPASFAEALPALRQKAATPPSVSLPQAASLPSEGGTQATSVEAVGKGLGDGAVVIAAITSCTNTSNPALMIGAGLLAKRAVERGLRTKPWVKTSLAPGSQSVTHYLAAAGLTPFLEQLGFFLVGYGCTTCIGNSGPLPEAVAQAILAQGLVVAAVLSGNRNFEARIHPDVRANYLASPPLVVAYALAGRIDINFTKEPLGYTDDGQPIWLRDVWPSDNEVQEQVAKAVQQAIFVDSYRDVYKGGDAWNALEIPSGDLYTWPASTYIQKPPYFTKQSIGEVAPIQGARVLAWLGDSVTTDHISPAGSIKVGSPAGNYLEAHGILPRDFNSYGARRGNHEVMMRGTFANVRLRNRLAGGVEGGVTRHLPSQEFLPIYDAAMRYQEEQVPLVLLAGKEYGSGSSRDWAAKGPFFLGVRAVLAESYERIHRSNLVGMGILPLQFLPGETPDSLGLTGEERFTITEIQEALHPTRVLPRRVRVMVQQKDGNSILFEASLRVDTPEECFSFLHGGILPFALASSLGTV